MIEINLLPEAMRRKKMSPLNFDIEMDKAVILIGGAFIAVLILLIFFLSIGSFIRKKEIQRLLVKEQTINPRKLEVEELDKETTMLKTKMNALAEITKRDFLWAKKLNDFSDLILPGIWYRRIWTDAENRLIIEGNVISKREEAMASVGKFMNNLREKQDFFKDFRDIKLESLQRKTMEERDVVDFRLVLYFNYDYTD